MKPRKAIKELRKQLKKDPDNVVLKIRLASLLRDTQQVVEAVEIYLQVARAYHAMGRVGQAEAVCKGILEFAPQDARASEMMAALVALRMQQEAELEAEQDALSPVLTPGYRAGTGSFSGSYPGTTPSPGTPTGRRKRPTSMPTPLADRGRESSMPGFATSAPPSHAEVPKRRPRRSSDSLTLSPRRPEVDFTVVGAAPAPLQGSRSFDLMVEDASFTDTPDDDPGGYGLPTVPQRRLGPAHDTAPPPQPTRPPPPEVAAQKGRVPAASPQPTRPAATRPPARSSQPPPPPPGRSKRTSNLPLVPRVSPPKPPRARPTGRQSVPPPPPLPREGKRPTVPPLAPPRPAPLAPAPTPMSLDDQTTPPPLTRPHMASADAYEPELEDATIVDANFDMAKFVLSQSQAADEADSEADDVDLPALPSRADTTGEVTRIATGAEEMPGVDLATLRALGGLPKYALRAIAAGAREISLEAGEALMREKELTGSVYVLIDGEVQILKRDPAVARAQLRDVGRVHGQGLIGEGALLGVYERNATVVTVAPSQLVEVPAATMAQLNSRYPALRPALELFCRERLVEKLMSSHSFMQLLSKEEGEELVGSFEPVRAAAGQTIIQEGSRSGGFYLLLQGSVQVAKKQVRREITLHAGDFFGEVSLLRGEPAQSSVVAARTTELARLDATRFYDLVSQNQDLWARIWRESSRSELRGFGLIIGTTSKV